jgi:TM2 domain-containing membrane protein YozV
VNRNPLVAFLLSFIPGLGHFYLGRYVRAFLYATFFFGPIGLVTLLIISRAFNYDGDLFAIFLLIVALLSGIINMIDMIVSLLKPTSSYRIQPATDGAAPINSLAGSSDYKQQNERFYTIILSLIPGLPHFQLGLMQRGLQFLVSFFGLFAMITFISFITKETGFFVFLLALPVILFYGLFDAMQLLNRKQRGEEITDRTLLEDLERNREAGRKSKPLALLLAVFPGAGHLYLGLQQRGLQFMAAFLLSIYLMDALQLSLFLYLIPIIWFYSLFDAMQMVSKPEGEELKDVPLIKGLMNHQRWVGIALMAIGTYYLLDSAIFGFIQEAFPELSRLAYWFNRYAQVIIISILFIFGGFKLMLGSKKKVPQEEVGNVQ